MQTKVEPRSRARAQRVALAAALLVLVGACGPPPPRVGVAAAASLRPWLESEASAQTLASAAVEMRWSFDASSRLRTQIEAGAEFSIFISADQEEMSRLPPHLRASEPLPILRNSLALVGARIGARSPQDLVALEGLIAVAGMGVPAGRLARRRLRDLGVLEKLESRLVSADHVRGALGLVSASAVQFALVYATDAVSAPDLVTLWKDDPAHGVEITAVLLSPASPEATRLFAVLISDDMLSRAHALGFGRIAPR